MVNYNCDKCYKTFTQKSHYIQHQKTKNIYKNNANKIKVLITNVFAISVNSVVNLDYITKYFKCGKKYSKRKI